MARRFLVLKAPSVATLSTGLTYIVLTGIFVAPAMTAEPRLPPLVEARAAPSHPSAQIKMVRSQTIPVAQATDADGSQTAAVAPPADNATVLAQPTAVTRADLRSLPAPRQIAEVRVRLKSIKAKDAPLDVIEVDKSDGTPINTARTDKPKREDDNPTVKRPPPTAVVPVASSVPVEPSEPTPPIQWSEAEIMGALKECLRLLAPVEAEVEANTAMRQGDCGTPAPILLKSVGSNPKIVFQPAAEVNCAMAVALSEWAKETLQPAARETLSSDVTRFVNASGYSCRNRYGLANERLSEHALANAIDIGGFALANGKVIKVSSGWGATARDKVVAANNEPQPKSDTKGKKDSKSEAIPTIKSKDSPTPAALKTTDTKVRKTAAPALAQAPPPQVDGTETSEGRFLRRLHKGACGAFGTVLGPEANEAHRDHFHFDLKARKKRSVCQ